MMSIGNFISFIQNRCSPEFAKTKSMPSSSFNPSLPESPCCCSIGVSANITCIFSPAIFTYGVLSILTAVNIDNTPYVKIAGEKIHVMLALTPIEQQQGLSGRDGLKDDEGMLFVFANSGEHLFWMKDMKFPIDIIWLNDNREVIYIKKNARPELYPETYGPASPSQGGPDTDAQY